MKCEMANKNVTFLHYQAVNFSLNIADKWVYCNTESGVQVVVVPVTTYQISWLAVMSGTIHSVYGDQPVYPSVYRHNSLGTTFSYVDGHRMRW